MQNFLQFYFLNVTLNNFAPLGGPFINCTTNKKQNVISYSLPQRRTRDDPSFKSFLLFFCKITLTTFLIVYLLINDFIFYYFLYFFFGNLGTFHREKQFFACVVAQTKIIHKLMNFYVCVGRKHQFSIFFYFCCSLFHSHAIDRFCILLLQFSHFTNTMKNASAVKRQMRKWFTMGKLSK